MSDKPISPLRQRMIDDMTARRERLRPARQDLRGLSRPLARYGNEGRPSPLSTAYGAATDQRRVHQRRHRRVALLFQRDARTARLSVMLVQVLAVLLEKAR